VYTYAIITTANTKELGFLHDRMPVILENGSEDIKKWLNPDTTTWTKDLQALLMPYPGELEWYPVPHDIGKVGNNSPTFILPIDSKENKSNIKNFFVKMNKSAKSEDSALAVKKEEEAPKGVKRELAEIEDAKQSDSKKTKIKNEPDAQ
jgi:hypothetical protein